MTMDLLAEIREITGDVGVLTGADVRARTSGFFNTDPCEAMAIVRPASTEEVSQVLKLCHEARQPVVTVGGATGLVRAAVAGPDELLLSLERMNEIEELDPSNRTAMVQSRVIMQASPPPR